MTGKEKSDKSDKSDEPVDPREHFLRPLEKVDRETLDDWGKEAAELIAEQKRGGKPESPDDSE